MQTAQNTFDHGAALRVPPAHDSKGWKMLRIWLGASGRPAESAGTVEVTTPLGACIAAPGDWIVLSVKGAYHVARSR